MDRVACGLIAVLWVGWAVTAQAETFTAANGARLEAPPIAQLDCDMQGTLLVEFAISGYREAELLDSGHPDWPIYEYENRLAESYYTNCQAGASHFRNSAPAFSSGFR